MRVPVSDECCDAKVIILRRVTRTRGAAGALASRSECRRTMPPECGLGRTPAKYVRLFSDLAGRVRRIVRSAKLGEPGPGLEDSGEGDGCGCLAPPPSSEAVRSATVS